MIFSNYLNSLQAFVYNNLLGNKNLPAQEVTSKIQYVWNKTCGAVKDIWFPVKNLNDTRVDESTRHAYYTARPALFSNNEKEIKQECHLMKEISDELAKNNGSMRNLALRFKELDSSSGIKGKYTVRVRRAATDFEALIQDPNKLALQDRLRLGKDFLSGFSNLHKAGYAYGDPKPENCLIYKNRKKNSWILKIADFGKSKKMSESQTMIYRGNMRFAPPEGVLSQKGDVYGAALVLIRNLEEEVLTKLNRNSFLEVDEKDLDIKAHSKLRGVEKFIVEHKAFLATNPGVSFTSLIRRFRMDKLTKQELKAQEAAIHSYIDRLRDQFQDPKEREKITKICDLLKQMTLSDPEKRMTSSAALEIYRAIV